VEEEEEEKKKKKRAGVYIVCVLVSFCPPSKKRLEDKEFQFLSTTASAKQYASLERRALFKCPN
jgi:hypothetical protein